MENFVITVNRQYASRGREVARRLSELLNIRCYDEELIEEAAEELELPEEIVGTEEETAVRKPLPVTRIPIILGKGSSHTQDDIFDAQASFMNKIVKEESCIIVGRCSDYILSDHKNALHIYIFAEYKARLRYCMEALGCTALEIKKKLREVDELRDSYSIHYSGYLAEDKEYKDILIDSSTMGIEKTAQFLAVAAKMKFGL